MGNSNLHKAKQEKNDEFYTQLSDIENELKHYKKHFKDKTIFLNCDDPEKSNFWKYFSLNFKHLGLKKLISTHYEHTKPSYKLEATKYGDTTRTPLKQNGDFRSSEAIELLKEADIVITNPPFSLFREYIAQLMEYNKQFIVIGPESAIVLKQIFPLIKHNKLWMGSTKPKTYNMPNGNITKHGNHCWFTNLDFPKRNEDLILFRTYNKNKYPKYDNSEVISIDGNYKNIPMDYTGEMLVSYASLRHFGKNQFDILSAAAYTNKEAFGSGHLYMNGQKKFSSIIIKRRVNED